MEKTIRFSHLGNGPTIPGGIYYLSEKQFLKLAKERQWIRSSLQKTVDQCSIDPYFFEYGGCAEIIN